MDKLEVLERLERGDISVDDAIARLSDASAAGTRPIWRMRLRVERIRLWLFWPPLAIIAVALLIPVAIVKEIARAIKRDTEQMNLWHVIAFIAQMSFVGGGLVIDVREPDGTRVNIRT